MRADVNIEKKKKKKQRDSGARRVGEKGEEKGEKRKEKRREMNLCTFRSFSGD